MTDNNEFKDMEIIRLVFRACGHNPVKTARVIAFCKGSQSDEPDIQYILQSVKETVEMMENKTITMEELVKRIQVAEPKNPLTF